VGEPALSPAFMEAAAAAVGLSIAAERAAGVRAHLDRIAEMATPLLARAIPDEIESAQVFEPGNFEPGAFEPGSFDPSFSKSGVSKP
jgi:hypothetical protein